MSQTVRIILSRVRVLVRPRFFQRENTPKTIANTASHTRLFIWMKQRPAIHHQWNGRKGGVNFVMVGRTDPSNRDNLNHYHCVYNLFTLFVYLMRYRSSTTALVTYVVLFCFLFLNPYLTAATSRLCRWHIPGGAEIRLSMILYVMFILNMAISAFLSKATLLNACSNQRGCFSQLSNCHQCFVIKLFLSTNRFWWKLFETPGWCSFQLTYTHFTTKQYWFYWCISSSNNPYILILWLRTFYFVNQID